jgi:methionine transaminase
MRLSAKISISSKQPFLETSIFAIMSGLAQKESAINLSQGFPDFQCHPKLIELMNKYMKMGYNQYAPMPGVDVFREAIIEKVEDLYDAKYDPENEITVTAGATEALYAAITSIVHPGDEVIVFEPWYDAYIPMVQYSGGKAISMPMELPDFHINWQAVKKSISKKTKAIILNSPHNPSGSVLSESDIKQLIAIVKDTSIMIISDEVYEHIIFDGTKHQSLARYPELVERSFVIGSFGKTFHVTGWKVGYCLAPNELMREFRKIHQFITFSVNTPVQYTYAEFMSDKSHYLELAEFYQKKRDLFRTVTSESRFELLPCRGTYFQLMSYRNISEENDIDFTKRLTKEHKIASIPTSVFYQNSSDNHIIRFCFAKKDETLRQAGELLCRI